MKAAFFFDTVLLKDNNENFYGMTLTYDFFKTRYLEMFDEMVVTTRVKKLEFEKGNTSGYKQTNGVGIEVKPVYNYKSINDAIIHRKEITKEIDNVVKQADKLIIRMPSVIGMFACESAKKYDKPYLIEMVACPWDGYMNHVNLSGKIIAPFMTILTKKYVKNAPNVLYVTNEFLQKRYPTKGKQIACSDVVLNDFDDDIINKRIDLINRSIDNSITLCTVANVGLKYKGHKYVIKALSRLKKQGKKYKYILVGNGDNSMLKELSKKYGVEDEVVFLGSKTHEDVFKILDSIDIYIQPSLQEGLPRALIEAMSRGCPAIGSNAGGIPELLDDKFIFKKRDVNGIISILNNIDNTCLIHQSKLNFNTAKKYMKEVLESNRKMFYEKI